MKEVKSTVYVTDDGKQFTNKLEAELHETKLNNVKCFIVRYAPDLTEGRGFQKVGYLLVHAKRSHDMFAEHYCYNRFGNKVEFCMGVYGSNAIIYNWSLREVKEQGSDFPILDKLEENFVTKIWS